LILENVVLQLYPLTYSCGMGKVW